MDRILYTIGYGNRKPDDFVEILKDAGIETVIDVRREGSRGYCFAYSPMGLRGKLKMIDIRYLPPGWLGNPCESLEDYAKYLDAAIAEDKYEKFGCLTSLMYDSFYGKTCLLCAEIDPAKCHRSILADRVVEMLGDGWEVIHL